MCALHCLTHVFNGASDAVLIRMYIVTPDHRTYIALGDRCHVGHAMDCTRDEDLYKCAIENMWCYGIL